MARHPVNAGTGWHEPRALGKAEGLGAEGCKAAGRHGDRWGERLPQHLFSSWVFFPKIRGSFVVVPVIGIIILWGLYWGRKLPHFLLGPLCRPEHPACILHQAAAAFFRHFSPARFCCRLAGNKAVATAASITPPAVLLLIRSTTPPTNYTEGLDPQTQNPKP